MNRRICLNGVLFFQHGPGITDPLRYLSEFVFGGKSEALRRRRFRDTLQVSNA